MGHRSTQINHQVGYFHHRHHLLKQFHVSLVVALAQVTHIAVILHKHIHTLVDGTVLNNSVISLSNRNQIAEAFLQEIHLHIKRPTVNIAVVILEIRVMLYGLEPRFPAIVFGQELGERRLATTYISCYCDMHT